MNSTLMRTTAIALAVGAIITAWLGYRLSTQASAPELPQVQITHPQLVASRDLPAGQILTHADVVVENLPQRHPSALTNAEPAVGKLTLVPLNKGTPILPSYFPSTSPVAQSLQPHERAVAIKVNEVIGVGGFVKPGDHVDVLLYLRADRETSEISSAQVVLNDVRVLAYGDDAAQPANSASNASSNDSSVLEQSANKLETMKAKDGKSAILAVSKDDTARLMLAENSGILKLALRGASLANGTNQGAKNNGADHIAERHFVQLQHIGMPATNAATVEAPKEPANTIKKITRTAKVNEDQVIVHHGDKVEIVKVRQ